jgi:pyrrolidone-carboxylate peptidase
MHVPALPEQVVGKVPLMPSMSKETIADAITTALEAMV